MANGISIRSTYSAYIVHGRSGSLRRWAAVAIAMSVFAGCGTESGVAVSGTVAFQGRPVTEGMVVFDDEKGAHLVAPLGSDGKYRIENSKTLKIPLGTYKVAIMPPKIEFPIDPTQTLPPPKVAADIPMKYRDAKTSGLALPVREGDNSFDINMTP